MAFYIMRDLHPQSSFIFPVLQRCHAGILFENAEEGLQIVEPRLETDLLGGKDFVCQQLLG